MKVYNPKAYIKWLVARYYSTNWKEYDAFESLTKYYETISEIQKINPNIKDLGLMYHSDFGYHVYIDYKDGTRELIEYENRI